MIGPKSSTRLKAKTKIILTRCMLKMSRRMAILFNHPKLRRQTMRSGPFVRTVESVNPGGSSSWRLTPRQATMGDFDPYASMAEWQRGVVEPFAQMSGIPPGTVLFTFALWASLPPSSSSYPGRRSRACTRSSPVRVRFVATKSQSSTWIELRTPVESSSRGTGRTRAISPPMTHPASSQPKEPTQSRTHPLSRSHPLPRGESQASC